MTSQKCGYLPKCSGIYKITNLVNGKFYIGSSVKMMIRKREHLDKLRRNIHSNKHLQRAWNKYGQDNFEFSVIELCSYDDLECREQHYLDNLCPQYNIAKYAYAATRGRTHTDEEKNHISIKIKTMWENSDMRKKILASTRTPEERKRRKESTLKVWKDPNYRKQHSESLYGKGNSKLSPNDVREIRRLYSLGIGSPKICKMFRLKSTRSVFRILEGITYRWVE